jgi:hypothetical protein
MKDTDKVFFSSGKLNILRERKATRFTRFLAANVRVFSSLSTPNALVILKITCTKPVHYNVRKSVNRMPHKGLLVDPRHSTALRIL